MKITLQSDPKIEFILEEYGFQLNDMVIADNTAYYTYRELESTSINKSWFPKLTKVLRVFTWVLNGVPFFPDKDSYKKAKLTLILRNNIVEIWLTDHKMVEKAKKIKKTLEGRI